jgi:hypothetical protein
MRSFHRLFHKSKSEDRLNKELRFHIEQQIAANIAAGMSPAEAAAALNSNSAASIASKKKSATRAGKLISKI